MGCIMYRTVQRQLTKGADMLRICVAKFVPCHGSSLLCTTQRTVRRYGTRGSSVSCSGK